MNESPIIMTLILKHHSGLEAALQPLLLLLYFSATLYNNVPTAAAAAVEQFEVDRLNYDSYDEMTESKTVFLKFFAPWCGHCKRMAKDWERLAEQWVDSKVGLVAEVDCTDVNDNDGDEKGGGGGGKMLCNHFGIESFPTIKYGDPNDLQDYNGKRSLHEMSKFAEEHLIPICSPSNLKLCDDDALAKMKQYLDLSINELHQFIELEEEKLNEAEHNFEAMVDRLTKEYEVAENVKRLMIEEISNGDLNLMKQILWKKEVFTDNHRRENNVDDDDDDDDEIINNNEL